MITANNLIDRFRQFAESHYFIRTFSFGDPSEIDITKLPEPPLMHVTYLGARYAPGLKVYSLEVYILDQPPITVAKQEYQQETVSDAEQCAEDVLADMEAGHNVFDFEFTVENASATPLRENASGLFAGVLLDLEVGVPYNNEACFAPLDGVQPGTDEQVYQRRGLLKVITEDGSVDVPSVNTIRVTNGTLTDNGSGVVTLDIGTSTGGAGQLNELDDVAITSPTQGQVLQYNATDGEWQNAAATLPATTDDLPEGSSNLYYTEARVSANTDVAANTAKNSYPTADATKLAGIEEGAQANVNADWNAVSGDAQILNKPTLFSGDYNDLTNQPAIPQNADDIAVSATRIWFTPLEQLKLQSVAYNAEPNVNADWNATTGDAAILNKPTLFSGDYNDLSNKPNLFSGDYNDLTSKPAIPANIGDLGDVPTTMGTSGQLLAVNSTGDALEYVAPSAGGGGISNVVEDLTPQLGGDLDVNGKKIVSVNNKNVVLEPDGTGVITPNKDIDFSVSARKIRVNGNRYVFTYLDTTFGLYFNSTDGSYEFHANGLAVLEVKTTGDVRINKQYYLPKTDGNAGDVMESDGAGQLNFVRNFPSDHMLWQGIGANANSRVNLGPTPGFIPWTTLRNYMDIRFDSDGNTANEERYLVPATGIYEVNGFAAFYNSGTKATDVKFILGMELNSTANLLPLLSRTTKDVASVNYDGVGGTAVMQLTQGDTIAPSVYLFRSGTGGTLEVVYASTYLHFAVRRIA